MPRQTRQHSWQLTFALACAFWVLGASGVWAQVQPAAHPIVTSRLERLVAALPDAPLDLPSFLATNQDVYLLVTVGASYTDIQVLANPPQPPQTLAHILSSTLEKAGQHGQMVEWSPGHYSAAQAQLRQSRIGAIAASNAVPVAALVSGLRDAGLRPHLLLRVPLYAHAVGLPPAPYSTRAFGWYDERHLGGGGSVHVSARLTWVSLARICVYFLLVPLVGALSLWMADALSRRKRGDVHVQRRVFRAVSTYPLVLAAAIQTGGMVYLAQTQTPAVLADLWLGSSSTSPLVPFLVAGIAVMPLFQVLSRRRETRRFGPVSTPAPFPMSDEEKAARKRVAQYSALPHLILPVLLVVVPLFVSRSSPLYTYLHPASLLLTGFGGILIARVFQKRLDKFTQKNPDDDLTWRARRLGQSLSVRMPNVLVEDSSRGAHLAFSTHQGHAITVSRTLQQTFTPAEMDFVLAHHLACMKRGGRRGRQWLRGLLFLPMLLPFLVLTLPHGTPGSSSLSSWILLPWFLPVLLGYFGVFLVLTIALSGSSVRQQVKRETEADRAALEVTGDLSAAEGALDKLNPEGLLLPTSTSRNTEANAALLKARLIQRRAALRQSAQALNLAPASSAAPINLSISRPAAPDAPSTR